jgi:ribosome-associated protein
MMDSRQLAEFCAKKCLEKKAENVVVLDLENKSSVADFFVICSGFSDRQVMATAEFVREETRRQGSKVYNSEGMQDGRWALIDFGAVIVHVFQDHLRDFYSLESLWQDVPRVRMHDEKETEAEGEEDNIARPSDFEPGSARY